MLRVEVASLWRVGLTWVTPDRALRHSQVRAHLRFIRVLRIRLPVLSGVAKTLLPSLCQHFLSLWGVIFVLGTPCVCEERWFVHQVVFNQVVSVLWGHFVITWLYGSWNALVVIRTETLVVLQVDVSTWLLHRGIFVVIAIQSRLSRLELGVWLITRGNKTLVNLKM